MSTTVPLQGGKVATDVGYFLRVKQLEAQVALFRGYFHDVNNALAGIGTLAEVMKDAERASLNKNLALMGTATQKSAILQRRVRALYSASDTAQELELGLFVAENSDLMELMLPHSQRLSFEIAENLEHIIVTKPETLWSLLSLMAQWLRESGAPRATLMWNKTLALKLEGEAKAPSEKLWSEIFSLNASWLGARVQVEPQSVTLLWS